ncbi:MAG: FKBP-type peptidyl-prolyl cis-trans isomerase [Parcubacteria group bacterium]
MNRNYIIGGIIIIIILSVAVYFQIQDNKKMYEELGINQNNNMQESQNQNINPPEELKVETIKEGTGQAAENGDTVSVHYVGTFEDGTKFDSSIDRGEPFSFALGGGQVIRGWDLGVLGMKIGEKRKLTIPSDLAYGATGIPGAIPGGATLIFEVELLGINQ